MIVKIVEEKSQIKRENISDLWTSVNGLFYGVSARIDLLQFRVCIVKNLHRPRRYRLIVSSQCLEQLFLFLFLQVFLHETVLIHYIIKSFSLDWLSIPLVIVAWMKLLFASGKESLTDIFNFIWHFFGVLSGLFFIGSGEVVVWVGARAIVVRFLVGSFFLFLIFLQIFHEERFSLQKQVICLLLPTRR